MGVVYRALDTHLDRPVAIKVLPLSPEQDGRLLQRFFTEMETVARTQLVGRTRGDQVVVFDGEPGLKGQLLDVEITRSQSLTLFGRLVEAPIALAQTSPARAS